MSDAIDRQRRALLGGALGKEMFDWDLRIRKMDEAGVRLALISLSSPNVFLAEREHSIKAAQAVPVEGARWPTRLDSPPRRPYASDA